MSNYAEWIDDMLGAAKEVQNPTAIHMIECCGKGCALRGKAYPHLRENCLELRQGRRRWVRPALSPAQVC